jgi:tetratricopeptide (TPR) repeat protein
MKSYITKCFLALTLLTSSGLALADEMMDAIAELQHAWATGYYSTPEKQQDDYFAALRKKALKVSEKFPGKAEPLIWEAIVTSTHAKYQNIFSAGGTAKAARMLLLTAEKIDPTALKGSALASLGALYYKVPRVISFGDHDKARDYLERALKINPNGIVPNFFYGEFLSEKGETEKAIMHLKKALEAPARPGREDADKGRHDEIRALLEKLK